ncbi:MAG: hypothetical protein EX271_03740 [Acidimicrobiales bacterium]|nr:hypothetical protein [Hyphomonadaceae bacterium]RZV43496.1 MAG: hypothetical protein EX271_03740 [Acidimicrobiales bacterium]
MKSPYFTSGLFQLIATFLIAGVLTGCATVSEQAVRLSDGIDASAGGGPAYIITTSTATYYLEKEGGGLSSMLDVNGVDWLGFHSEKGSGHKGEYRGFPNAVHRQDGNYFHAMNAGTDPSTSVVDIESGQHVRITFTSDNGQWEGQWDFYSDRCDFTMSKVSDGYKYWVQYEGVPGGKMDSTDFWYRSGDKQRYLIEEQSLSDLPGPEWMAFGDQDSPRMLYVVNHTDDNHPDDYVSRPHMTVLGFGRRNKDKFLTQPQTFSIGFVESTDYTVVENNIKYILD